jgi:hypothetical protein
MTPLEEWPHHFIHTLEGIPGNWHIDQEMCRITTEWIGLQQNFVATFSFEHENPNIDSMLKLIWGVIFVYEPEVEIMTEYQQQNIQTVKHLLSCYHVEEEKPDEDDMCNIQITEIEGDREVEVPSMESELFFSPIKVNKVNIGMNYNPKMASIGDYWDEQTVERITKLLHEYSDLFPTTFTEMKGVVGELGEMKIPLKLEAIPVRKRPYRLNPVYKQKMKEKIDRMLEVGIIEPVEEFEWIIPMVFQEKKKGGIRIGVYMRKLNDACLHNPFPTPFIDEVLENVRGHEAYSFTDGFSGYHQIKIASEDRFKTTFSTEWGSYQYKVMTFGMKNAPTIFSRVVIASFKEFIQ